jgi:hypothetical protein
VAVGGATVFVVGRAVGCGAGSGTVAGVTGAGALGVGVAFVFDVAGGEAFGQVTGVGIVFGVFAWAGLVGVVGAGLVTGAAAPGVGLGVVVAGCWPLAGVVTPPAAGDPALAGMPAIVIGPVVDGVCDWLAEGGAPPVPDEAISFISAATCDGACPVCGEVCASGCGEYVTPVGGLPGAAVAADPISERPRTPASIPIVPRGFSM